MKRRTLSLAIAIVLSSVIPVGGASSQGAGVSIAGVEAKLFYSNSGRLSANILGNRKIVLHNAPIGEGTIEGPSENTLVVVRLAGPPKGMVEGLRLRIVATTEKDTLADREIDVGTMNTAGNYYAACWLEDTGCDPVTVMVALVDGKASQRIQVVIPFECSE